MRLGINQALVVFFIFCFSQMNYAQDLILLLNNKEIPSLVEKEDSFLIYYTSMKKVKRMEKSEIADIHPHQFVMKSGEIKPFYFCIDSFDLSSPYLYYREAGKPKTIAKHKVFNVRKRNMDSLRVYADTISVADTERMIYMQDTLDRRFVLTEYEMRCWVMGRRSARKHFKSPLSTLGGAFVGLGGGLLNFFVSPLPSTVFVAVNGAIKPKVGKTAIEDAPFLNEELFVDGYRMQAGKKKLMNSLLGTLPGLAAGVLINAFLIP